MNDAEILNLIIKKGVAVGFIQMLIKDNLGGYKEYNDFIGSPEYHLTKKEFNLIAKRVI